MKLKSILIGIIASMVLISCGPSNGGETKPNIDETSDVVDSEESNEPDPTLPLPTKAVVTQNKSEYIFSESINYNDDYTVNVTFNDGSNKNMKYDANKKNGWHFVAISNEAGQALSKLPQPFNELCEYKVRIGATFNHKTVKSNKIYKITIVGGSHSDKTPDKLEVINKRASYILGDKFTENDLLVKATWNTMGGEEILAMGDGQNGYTISGVGFDLTHSLDEVKTYVAKVNYRGLSQEVDLKVVRLQLSEINYDYNNFNEDSCFKTDIMPTKGTSKALIVPVWFTDSNKYIKTQLEKDQVRKDIELAYNGTSEETGWESVHSYYLKDSYGKLTINGVVADWYEAGVEAATINIQGTKDLIKAVSDNYKNSVSEEEWRTFDSDHNGYIDVVICIYAYPNYVHLTGLGEKNENQNLWAYCFWLQNKDLKNVNNPGPNTFFWASYDFMYQGLGFGSPMKIDAHTYIHEMGHVLGLVDYYDYNNVTTPAGGFSMQDQNVGGHDPFSRLAYGWVDPIVPKDSMSVSLRSFEETGDLLLLSPDFDGSAFDEYLLVEYYTPTGLNELDSTYEYMNHGPLGPDSSGLRVWHIDARLINFFEDENGNESFSKELTTRKMSNSDGVTLGLSNTTYVDFGSGNPHLSNFEEYYDLDIIALLNHYTSGDKTPYPFNFRFSNRHMWQEGDTFSMEEFAYSFPKVGKLNKGIDLGFSFEVLKQNEDSITINVVKER